MSPSTKPTTAHPTTQHKKTHTQHKNHAIRNIPKIKRSLAHSPTYIAHHHPPFTPTIRSSSPTYNQTLRQRHHNLYSLRVKTITKIVAECVVDLDTLTYLATDTYTHTHKKKQQRKKKTQKQHSEKTGNWHIAAQWHIPTHTLQP